jgi:hypothetical protein
MGSFFGLLPAFYYRRVYYVPAYAISVGLAYGALHGVSAYFRNEI